MKESLLYLIQHVSNSVLSIKFFTSALKECCETLRIPKIDGNAEILDTVIKKYIFLVAINMMYSAFLEFRNVS